MKQSSCGKEHTDNTKEMLIVSLQHTFQYPKIKKDHTSTFITDIDNLKLNAVKANKNIKKQQQNNR